MTRRLSPVLLAATVMVAGCGGGSDADTSDANAVGSPTPTVTVSISATPKTAKPKPSATPSAASAAPAAPAAPAATPKPTKPAPATPAYRAAMPDGRTSPLESDWKFDNLTLFTRAGALDGTVDVTYKGPGLASMFFTVVVSLDNGGLKETTTFKGSVSAMRPDAIETVNLGGGNETAYFSDSTTYEGVYTIDSMSDDDPKARAD